MGYDGSLTTLRRGIRTSGAESGGENPAASGGVPPHPMALANLQLDGDWSATAG